ncbi:MAG: LLM class F420-dependent oxidoreductase [Acidimicrobiales bacterium]
MRLGVVYPQTELGGDPVAARRLAAAVEELGFDHLLAHDHVLGAVHAGRNPPLTGPYTERDPFHDPLVLFAHMGAMTERIELATGILILPQRQTMLAARQAADVDLLSGERLRLGVGVGWSPVEYEAMGQDFGRRGAREEGQINLLRRLWAEPIVEFHGGFDRVDRAALVPKPRRVIPIWLGGYGPRAYDRAAQIGDGFIFGGRVDDLVGRWMRLRDRVVALGRSADAFGGDYVVLSRQGVDALLDKLGRWRDAGGTHASVVTMGLGLASVDAHIDYLATVASKLRLG